MPGPKCSVCDLDASVVGILGTVHSMTEKGGKLVKVSMMVCEYCKEHHLDIIDNNEQKDG